MVYALAFLAVATAGLGYFLGWRSRQKALRVALADHAGKLAIAEQEIIRHTAVDPVTGLHMQRHFQEFLEREWRRASRQRQAVSVIMIEIDHFRGFHERQGPVASDACLRNVANALKALIHRPSDALTLYGDPGKFGVVLGGTDRAGAVVLAGRLRAVVEGLRTPNPVSSNSPFVTATLGVASATPDRDAAWQDIELIAAAENALDRAKDAGRNVVMASPA